MFTLIFRVMKLTNLRKFLFLDLDPNASHTGGGDASLHGIKNGITVVLHIGNSFLWNALNLSLNEPLIGMNNIASSSAISGIRLSILKYLEEDDQEPFCDFDGIDIPLGVSAIVGLKAKKIVHLGQPYTDCTSENGEYRFMWKLFRTDGGRRQLNNDDIHDMNKHFNGVLYNEHHCR